MPEGARILQVHPTLTCNLRCRHCYSASGPELRDRLPVALLERVVAGAGAAGYEVLSVSGGEPFAYPELGRLLAFAQAQGMRTAVASNGTLLERRLESVAPHLDGLALSLDGPPEQHDAMRASPRAFERLERGIDHARVVGVPFGLIYTVTTDNWTSIPWAAELAVERGARLLQLHPLEPIGRAAGGLRTRALDRAGRAQLYLLARALEAEYGGSLGVQLDLLLRRDVEADPELVYAGEEPESPLRSLVIEADGTLSPIAYGFGRRFALGNVVEEPFAAAWQRWPLDGRGRFRALCSRVHAQLLASSARVVDWHHLVVHASRRRAPAEALAGALDDPRAG
jgi:MoaA/NifB/PqqE/SkfB family radical SAM enzyme